jgi:very-short-patch-repair endonuclease
LCGLKFRRQHVIDPFIADFVCVEHHLVVEIDGGYHDYIYESDLARQQHIEALGWMVIRFANEDILGDFESVAIAICKQLGLPFEYRRRAPSPP